MENITTALNEGKNNWKLMTKKLLNEATSELNISPNAPISDVKPQETTKDTLNVMQKNISTLGDTPEYIEYRKNNDVAISNDEKTEIFKNLNKVNNLNKTQNIPTDEQIDVTIEDNDYEKTKIVNEINKKLKEFSSTTDDAIKMFGGGGGAGNLSTTYRSIPQINSLNDFKNTIKTIDGRHIISSMLPFINKQLEEARVVDQKIKNVANVVDDTSLDTIARFTNWLIRGVGAQGSAGIKRNSLITILKNVMSLIHKLEVLETTNLALEKLKQKVIKFRELNVKSNDVQKLARKLAQELKSEIPGFIKIDDPNLIDGFSSIILNTKQTTNQNVETPNIIQEPINESMRRTGHGPGKVLDITQQHSMSDQISSYDPINAKKAKIQEGWSKYKNIHKDDKNNEKPNDFSVVIG